jgi:hypothetical protein
MRWLCIIDWKGCGTKVDLSIPRSLHPSIHLPTYLPTYLWFYSPCGPCPLFRCLYLYTVDRTPWTSDQPVARPLPTKRTIKTKNKRTQTSIPWVGFEPTFPVFERAKTVRTLDRAATVIGRRWTYYLELILNGRENPRVTSFRTTIFLSGFELSTFLMKIRSLSLWHFAIPASLWHPSIRPKTRSSGNYSEPIFIFILQAL